MQCVCIPLERFSAAGRGLFEECSVPAEYTFVAADGGDGFTIGVLDSGKVVGWGRTFYGELPGDESESSICTAPGPVQLDLPEKCVSVACGSNHVLAVTNSGRVMAWGWNKFGQAGTADRIPAVVNFPSSEQITAVAAGGTHSLAIDVCGRAWAWGCNIYGQLGVNLDADQCHTPTLVALPSNIRVVQIAAGWAHSVLVSSAGEVFTFGWGLYNQLGHGSTQDESVPAVVDALQGLDSKIVQVACGNWHTAALSASGDLYTWGWGRDGQLRHDSVATQVLPRVVTVSASPAASDAAQDVLQVACGPRFTLALCRGGSVQWWGPKPAANSLQVGHSIEETDQERQQNCPRVRKLATGHSHAILLLEAQPTSHQHKQ